MSEQSLPIDIHTNKLLDWLISRRHCNKEWQHSLNSIRDKIKNAIQDMPHNQTISELLAQNYIDYFVCLQIVEILKETESDSKNIFGYYSSQRMKDWQEIIKLYEKDNIFLAESAQILIRNVNYEVPSLKKQVIKFDQIIEECEKSSQEYVKQSANYKNEFYASAEKLGITGNDIKQELINQLSELPLKLNQIAEGVRQLALIKDYYIAFLQFTLKTQQFESLNVLNYMLENGNTTYYQYRTGEVPDIIIQSKIGEHDEQLDCGDGIDFGDDNASSESPSNGNGDFVHIDKEELSQHIELSEHIDTDINWEIAADNNISVIDITKAVNEKVARDEDAYTILENSFTRNLFINELIELEGFLDQRLFEMRSEEDIVSSNQFQSAPSLLHMTTPDGVSAMLDVIKKMFNLLTSPKMKVLYYMKDSVKYIDNVIEKLKHIESLSEKALQKSQNMVHKGIKAIEEKKVLEPKIPLLINRTRELQKQIENDISKRYKNRPVNIMGGVQVL